MPSGIDKLFKPETPGSALDHDVLEAKIIKKDDKYWGKVDGEPKLWGPVQDAGDANVGQLVMIGISQNEKVWLISGGGSGGTGTQLVAQFQVGDGFATSFVLTHNFGMRRVVV